MPHLQITKLIEDAFADTPRPGDDFDDISATRQDEGIVDYFRGATWRGHAVADLRHHCAALSFFTDAAFRYWLPAFMLASLEDEETADVIPESIEFSMRRQRKISLFTPAERLAIAAFLEDFARRWDLSDFQATAEQIRATLGEAQPAPSLDRDPRRVWMARNVDCCMELRDQPWRAVLAIACAIAAGMNGPMAVDAYHSRSDYIASTILIVVGLAFAWRAIWSRVRWDRILGYPVFVLLALVIILMFIDRVG